MKYTFDYLLRSSLKLLTNDYTSRIKKLLMLVNNILSLFSDSVVTYTFIYINYSLVFNYSYQLFIIEIINLLVLYYLIMLIHNNQLNLSLTLLSTYYYSY